MGDMGVFQLFSVESHFLKMGSFSFDRSMEGLAVA